MLTHLLCEGVNWEEEKLWAELGTNFCSCRQQGQGCVTAALWLLRNLFCVTLECFCACSSAWNREHQPRNHPCVLDLEKPQVPCWCPHWPCALEELQPKQGSHQVLGPRMAEEVLDEPLVWWDGEEGNRSRAQAGLQCTARSTALLVMAQNLWDWGCPWDGAASARLQAAEKNLSWGRGEFGDQRE